MVGCGQVLCMVVHVKVRLHAKDRSPWNKTGGEICSGNFILVAEFIAVQDRSTSGK